MCDRDRDRGEEREIEGRDARDSSGIRISAVGCDFSVHIITTSDTHFPKILEIGMKNL